MALLQLLSVFYCNLASSNLWDLALVSLKPELRTKLNMLNNETAPYTVVCGCN